MVHIFNATSLVFKHTPSQYELKKHGFGMLECLSQYQCLTLAALANHSQSVENVGDSFDNVVPRIFVLLSFFFFFSFLFLPLLLLLLLFLLGYLLLLFFKSDFSFVVLRFCVIACFRPIPKMDQIQIWILYKLICT